MTNYADANEAFAQRFSDTWSPTGFPFELENEKFTPPNADAETPWARMVVRHRDGTQNSLGRVRNRRFDRLGGLFVQVFTPLQEGTRRAKELAQLVIEGFEGSTIPGTTICFNNTIAREVGVSDDVWFMTVIEIDFRYTEIR